MLGEKTTGSSYNFFVSETYSLGESVTCKELYDLWVLAIQLSLTPQLTQLKAYLIY